jgi:hypothetical protein
VAANNPKVTFSGETGTAYTYTVFPIGTRFKPGQSGNYIFTRRVSGPDGNPAHLAVYIGESAEGLQERFDSHEKSKNEEIAAHGASHICVHNNSIRAAREAEETDLRRKYKPPCNHE